MDVFEWLRKHKIRSILLAIVFFVFIPFGIDKFFDLPAISPCLDVKYNSKDILAFYGIILGSATTILALIETIQHAEKVRAQDYERQTTPLLDSLYYNHSNSSITPYRVLYVNTRPCNYYENISVLSSIDLRDLNDVFFGEQIDYLVQNISDASAVDIKVYLNDQLLHGPFSLIAGSEASIGIFFFDEAGHMIGDYPNHQSFHISITYTNGIRSKCFKQEEEIAIEYNFMGINGKPRLIPDYNNRQGLSDRDVIQ